MAKSATISKNTKSKKQNKKPSKLGNFLSKLNPNTPKKKLLTFVLVFALAGGGYFAYKSMAATASWVYSANNGTVSLSTVPESVWVRACEAQTNPDPGKNNALISHLSCHHSKSKVLGIDQKHFAVVKENNAYITSWLVGKSYRGCALVRSDKSTMWANVVVFAGDPNKASGRNNIKYSKVNNNYTKVCTDPIFYGSPGEMDVKVIYYQTDPSDGLPAIDGFYGVDVASLVLEML